MKTESMFYIALGTVVDLIASSDAYKEYASTEDHKPFRNKYRRLSLKNKAKALVMFDREMDRLVKEYGV